MRFKFFSKCDKCNTWVRSRSKFYSLHKTSKCVSQRDAGQVDVVIDDTELYELGQPVHDDDDEDDHMLLPPVEEGEVAHGHMPSYGETGSFDANLAVEGEDTAQDHEANARDFWVGPQGQEEDIEDEEEYTEDLSDAERHGTAAFNTLLDEELMMEEFDKATSDDLLLASSLAAGKVFPNKTDDECDLKVKEVALFELRKKMEMKLTDAAFEDKLRSTKFYLDLLEPNNNYPTSEHTCRKLLDVEDVWEYSVHYCSKCFTRYGKLKRSEWLQNKDETCDTDGCEERRFECRKTKGADDKVYPRAYFIYFGVKKAILSSYAARELPALRAQPNARVRDDIWGGELVKRMNASQYINGQLLKEEDVKLTDGSRAKLRKCGLLDVGFDGAHLWTHKQYSMDFFVMRYWDVPFEVRGKSAFTMLLGLYPQSVKQGKMQDVFLQPFVEEMDELGKDGVEVFDPYLHRSYLSKWFLGTVSADTPARNTVGKFYGVSGFRADYRSLFQGAKFSNISSDGTYFAGYCAEVKQPMFFGHEMMLANDPRLLLTHEKSLELASCVQNGKVKDGVLKKMPASVAGRHGIPPLAELSYFDLHFGYLLPWIHAGPWGVLKSFWKYLLRDYTGTRPPAFAIPNADRKKMSSRAKYLVLTSDMGRPYTDIVRYKGTWVMENWLHWAETFCPVIAHDVLKESCPQAFDAWMHLRRAFLHYLCSHEWYDHLDARQKEKARVEAKVSMRTYAEFVESKLGIQFCTINLRMLTVHSYEQEIQTGPIKHTLEFWVERAIQRYKKWVKDRVVLQPDIFLGNCYLLECALNDAAAAGRDVHEMIYRAPRQALNSENLDDVKLYQHLVGSGKQVEVTEAFVGDKLDLLRRFLHGRGQEVMDSALERGEVSVHVFLRAKVDLEVFHSVEYLRTRSRCSHHVCYQLKGDDASTRRYGRVLRYYKMQEKWAQGTFRFCEMDCFREITTEEDKALGYGTVSKASPDTMFVALEDFRRKVILFEPPDCKARDEARVLQCWTKGRI